jgi:hypothetical protein
MCPVPDLPTSQQDLQAQQSMPTSRQKPTTSAAANVANGEPFGALHWINIAAVSWGCAFRTISLLVIFNTMPFALCCGSELIADKNMKSSVFFSTSALHSF